jgi:peptidoglycan/LPS O-acetylase OafA/YrhL
MSPLAISPEKNATRVLKSEPGGRFYSLDALRGIAALMVVVYHWTLFTPGYFPPAAPVPLVFEPILRPFYVHGFAAVDMFFVLSGFIFYWLYSKSISERETSGWNFSLNRFSRLYPLHFVTLLLAACLHYVIRKISGYDYVYTNNTPWRFILQLFFICNTNFNGPIWTVSREILCYVVFFILCRFNLRRWWHVGACVGFGALIAARQIQTGSLFAEFFLGGLAYYTYVELDRRSGTVLRGLIAVGALIAWISACVSFKYQPLAAVTFLRFFVFPLTVVGAALNEKRWMGGISVLKILGDISYSSYLLHFPLQLLCVAVLLTLGKNISVMQSPLPFLLFLAVIVAISTICYRRFERPMQTFLRQRLQKSF